MLCYVSAAYCYIVHISMKGAEIISVKNTHKNSLSRGISYEKVPLIFAMPLGEMFWHGADYYASDPFDMQSPYPTSRKCDKILTFLLQYYNAYSSASSSSSSLAWIKLTNGRWMYTGKSVLPLRPRYHVHASMLLDGSEDDQAVSTSSLRPPTNDSQTRIHTRAVSAKVRIVSAGFWNKIQEKKLIVGVIQKCYNFKVQDAPLGTVQ